MSEGTAQGQKAKGQEQKTVPEGWSVTSLSEIVEADAPIVYGIVQAGPHVENGVPYIKSTNVGGQIKIDDLSRTSEEIARKYARAECKPGDIVFSLRGNIGELSTLPEDLPRANLTQGTARVRVNQSVASGFVAAYLKSPGAKSFIEKAAKGSTFQEISLEQLRRLPILLPPLPEQRKIAAILSEWDDSLSTLGRLIEAKRQQKRGLAEQLLTGKRRLKGFAGEWENLRFGDVFSRVTRKNTEGNDHALTVSGTHGLIDQREFFNKRVAANDLSGYYLIRRGEFAYNKSYSAGYDFGAIKRLNRYDAGVVSTLYICFALKRDDADSDFYEHFFEGNLLNEGISGIAQEGARNHGLLNVSVTEFFELELPFPPSQEQQAIASVLSTLDEEISSLEAMKASVQQQKRGLMDALLTGRVRVRVEEA